MVSREQVRAAFESAYRRRKDDRFIEMLLRGATDPIRPQTEEKKRRFHPLLVIGIVLAIVSLAAIALLVR
jgi:hypothetical protein